MALKRKYSKSLKEFSEEKNKNVFIIMRFSNKEVFKQIESTIKWVLSKYGLRGFLARDVKFHDLLWEHVRTCMENSRYAIIVFEKILEPDFNPNVALELGYMLAIGKECLILKDSSMKNLHSDVMGHLYESFDSYNIEETISTSLESWLMKLGHNLIPPSRIITDEIPIEAYKKRTKEIIEELKKIEDTPKFSVTDSIIRQAASLSSLAICGDEEHEDDKDGKLLSALITERNLFENLLNKKFKLKLIVSPHLHVARIRSGHVSKPYVEKNILPRYNRLIEVIQQNAENEKFQIVHADAPHFDNLIIIGNKLICKGEKRANEKGFKSTTFIYNPSEIGTEIFRFDEEFKANAGLILKKENTQSKDHSSKELKDKVIVRLKKSIEGIRKELDNL